MSSVADLQHRLAAARERLRGMPPTGPGELGAPDPQTGERWHRGNVLGHVAEMVPFWAGQAEAVLGGATTVGRDQAGSARRREGIQRGDVLSEADLRAEVERGLDELDGLLGRIGDEDLDRRVTYRPSSGPEQTTTLGGFLENLLVGHLESHLDQLEELG